jgi:hypothetical protein
MCNNNEYRQTKVRTLTHMPEQYESTSPWIGSLQYRDNVYQAHRDRLRTAYEQFRGRAADLTQQIHRQLPDLTLHDVTHLDALWEIASLIAGSDYPLNPLEGFVFGGAILLHDAALCFEAYNGGGATVRATPDWKDAYSAECSVEGDHRSDVERGIAADFSALRTLHAAQAEHLAGREWSNPDGGGLYLISDDQ